MRLVRKELACFLTYLLCISSIASLSSCDRQSTTTTKRIANSTSARIAEGKLAPDFSLTTLDGKKFQLSQLKGKVVMLNFWATWCAPCVAEMPSLQRLYTMYKDKGFEIVAINVDGEESLPAVRNFVDKNNLTFPVILDPNMISVSEYGVTGFPETFLIDRHGSFVAINDPTILKRIVRIVSKRPWDATAFTSIIEGLLGDDSVKPASGT